MSVKTGQRLIQERFKKPAREVIWDLYYQEDLSMPGVAQECGVSATTIQNWMREWGWERRQRGVQLVPPPRPAEGAANG